MVNFTNKFLVLALVFGNIFNIITPIHAETQSLTAVQFVDNISLETVNGPVTSNKISDSSMVNSIYNLNIPNGEIIDTYQYYTMMLPQELKPISTAPLLITKDDGTILGTVTVQNNIISIKFEPIINKLSNRVLNFNFWSALNKEDLDYNLGNDLIFPTKYNPNNKYHMNFYKSGSGGGSGTSAISKTLRYETNNIVTWTITINNGGYTVENSNFFDTMSNTQNYIPGSSTIFYRNYKNTTIKSDKTDLNFNSNPDGSKSIALNFGRLSGDVEASLTKTNSIVIHYKTKMIFNPSDNKYPNHASAYDGDTIIDSVISTATYHGQGGSGGGATSGNIIVKYVDEFGNKLSDDTILTGNIGDDYTTDRKSISGYTFKEVQGNISGQYTDKAQNITYVYTKNPVKAADVTVRYVDTDGNKISNDVVKSGNIGDDYTTDRKSISGYTFKEVQGNVSGQFTDKAQNITYVYTKNPIKAADVTVRYVDTNGNKISNDVVKSGNIGDDYTTDRKSISGYTFKEVQGTTIGIFIDKEQIVTYIYEKEIIKNGEVTIQHINEEGKKISEDTVLSGIIGDSYTIEQKKISEYTIQEIRGNITGVFTNSKQTVTFVYRKNKIVHLPITGEEHRIFLFITGLILLVLGIVNILYDLKRFKL